MWVTSCSKKGYFYFFHFVHYAVGLNCVDEPVQVFILAIKCKYVHNKIFLIVLCFSGLWGIIVGSKGVVDVNDTADWSSVSLFVVFVICFLLTNPFHLSFHCFLTKLHGLRSWVWAFHSFRAWSLLILSLETRVGWHCKSIDGQRQWWNKWIHNVYEGSKSQAQL